MIKAYAHPALTRQQHDNGQQAWQQPGAGDIGTV